MTELNLLDQEHKTYLDQLVGEGKKFSDSEALAKGKWEADNYIKTKEAEFDKLREDYMKLRDDYNARAKLEEMLDKITTQNNQQQTVDTTRNSNNAGMPTIDLQQIKSLVSNTIQENEMTRKQVENFNLVKEKLSEQLGSNFQSKLKETIDSLGMSEQEANDMARRSPKAFLKLVMPEQQTQNFQAPPQSTQRPTTFAPKSTKRDWAYYEDLRVNQPKVYYDNKTQVQLHRDMTELGPDVFYNDPNWIAKT